MRHLAVALCVAGLVFTVGCSKKKTKIPSWFQSNRSQRVEKIVRRDIPLETVPVRTTTSTRQLDSQHRELRNRIDRLKRKVSALESVLSDLNAERRETVRKLVNTGVDSSKDLKGNVLAQTYAKNLHAIRKEMKEQQVKLTLYKVSLEEGQALLNRVSRRLELARAGVEDDDLDQLHAAILRVNAKLQDRPTTPNLGDQLELEAVVDEELLGSN